MSKSQLNQDLNVIDFFSNMFHGFFLDIGAYNGYSLSNTYLLEKNYKWSGICSEPLPSAFNELCNCRDVICDNQAVFSKSGLSLQFSECTLLSGITEFIDGHMYAKNGKQITVQTITLNDLLMKYNAPNIIHYLSLDTEGTELEILNSVDLSKYIFLYINLEHNHIEPRRSKIKNLLVNNGYLYKGENKWDDDYIHESTVTGTYYYKQNYMDPILIKRISGNNFSVSSQSFEDDTGEFKNGSITWSRFGKGKIFYNRIDYGNDNIWHRDNRKLVN